MESFLIYLSPPVWDAPIGDPGQLAETGFQAFQTAKGVEADLTSRGMIFQKVGDMGEKFLLLNLIWIPVGSIA